MAQMKRKAKGQKRREYRLSGAFTLLFALLFVLGLYRTQVILLENAQEMGNELASRYAAEVFHHVDSAETLLALGLDFLGTRQEAEGISEKKAEWVQQYFRSVQEIETAHGLTPWAVVDSVSFTKDGRADTDLTQTRWYREAVQAGGETVYTDGNDGEFPAIAIACSFGTSGDAMAFTLSPEGLTAEGSAPQGLPAGSSYFLCGTDGELLYAETALQVSREELAGYIRTILGQIQSGQLDDARKYIYDLSGEKRAVCFNTASNGWVSIITIPYSALLGDLRQVFIHAMTICGALLLFLLVMSIREHRIQKKMSRVSETVSALGNLYHSLYRVNGETGTYEAIKGSELLPHPIPRQGPYDQLLEEFGQVIEQETFAQFKESFSLQNIRHLVEEGVSDFGGDFRRLFDGEYRWVNVRLLFDASLQPEEAILCFRQVEQEKVRQLQQLQMLEDALDSVRQSEEAREQFFSQMSHDMRTPLNVIIGAAQLADREADHGDRTGDCLKKSGWRPASCWS